MLGIPIHGLQYQGTDPRQSTVGGCGRALDKGDCAAVRWSALADHNPPFGRGFRSQGIDVPKPGQPGQGAREGTQG